jgi:polysaccharide biosynthesis/export protein
MRFIALPAWWMLLALGAAPAAQPQQTPNRTAQPQQPSAPTSDPTTPKPAVPSQQPAPAAVVDQYVIGPQDTLMITVIDENDLTAKYRVDGDGSITLPYLGRMPAAGLSVEELRKRITAGLQNGWIRNPQVLVGIEQYKARSVVVTGAVRAPQKVTLTGLTMTLLEALALAGSPTSEAANEVIVVHPAKPGEKEPRAITVNRRDLELGKAGMDIVLQDGDIINVPVAKKFWVSGYVKNQGAYVYDSGMTVAQALILAGGLTERGSDRRITIKREVNGKVTEVSAKLEDKVQPNDEIIVGSRLF